MTHSRSVTTLLLTAVGIATLLFGSLMPTRTHAVIADVFVSLQGVNTNPGTIDRPVRDLSKAYQLVPDGGTIFMFAGTYEMNGWSISLTKRITLIGEGPEKTILNNPGTISLRTKGITIKDLKFTQADGTVIALSSLTGEALSGINLENVHFVDVVRGIDGASETGHVSNVRLTSVLMDTVGGSGNAKAVEIQGDLVEDVVIENSTFRNITSTEGLAIALRLGVIEGRDNNIIVRNNTFENILGNQAYVGGADVTAGYETHAVQAYGRNILITRNTIKNINPGPDHEPIYIKARDSEISYNQIEPGSQNLPQGSQGNGDITIKGEGGASDNVIRNNTILSGNNRQALYVMGKATIHNNCIYKPNAGSQMIRNYNGSETDTSIIPIVRNNKVFQRSGPVMMVFSIYGVEIYDNDFLFTQTGTIGDMTKLNGLGYARISGNNVINETVFSSCPTVGASSVTQPPTGTPCQNTLTSTVSIPTGYGASYNLFTTTKELLVRATCSGTTATLSLGSPTTYTYTSAYTWNGTSWQRHPLTCQGRVVSSSWCAGIATAATTLTQNPTALLGYTCSWVNNAWKCGCRDTTCTTSSWQMQRVQR